MKKLLAGCFISLFLMPAVFAGAGHDHGEEEAPSLPHAPASPRLVMESSQFELVGILEENGLHLYLDDYASNAPVTDATLELEIAGQRITAMAEADGSYHALLSNSLSDGQHPVMVTILAKQGTDLLIGELDVHVEEEVTAEVDEENTSSHNLLPWLLALLGFALAIVAFALQRDRQQQGDSI